MRDYIRRMIISNNISAGLRRLFKIERKKYDAPNDAPNDADIEREKREELERIKDELETMLIRDSITPYEYYIIIGYLDEYAVGKHFQDIPTI